MLPELGGIWGYDNRKLWGCGDCLVWFVGFSSMVKFFIKLCK